MRRLRSARLVRAVIVTALLLLPACSRSVGTPTVTTSGAVAQTTPAMPIRPAPPSTPGTLQASAILDTPTPAPTPTATRRATPLTGVSAILNRLTEATALTIQHDWNGLSWDAPVEARYSLYRKGDRFVGPGRQVVGTTGVILSNERGQRVQSGEIIVPLATIETFLRTLITVPLREGAYQPKITHFDDYPRINILIATPVSTIWFFTSSNEPGYAPWGAVIGEQTYVVDSPIPGQALKQLRDHLNIWRPAKELSPSLEPLPCRGNAPPVKPVAAMPAPALIVPQYTTSSPGARSQPRIGETINIAEREGLRSTQRFAVYAPVRSKAVEEQAIVEQLIGMLNDPAITILSSRLGPTRYDSIEIVFPLAEHGRLRLHYHLSSDEIYLQNQSSSEGEIIYAVRAPAEFGALLLSQLCAP
jgi:hypothetical protein